MTFWRTIRRLLVHQKKEFIYKCIDFLCITKKCIQLKLAFESQIDFLLFNAKEFILFSTQNKYTLYSLVIDIAIWDPTVGRIDRPIVRCRHWNSWPEVSQKLTPIISNKKRVIECVWLFDAQQWVRPKESRQTRRRRKRRTTVCRRSSSALKGTRNSFNKFIRISYHNICHSSEWSLSRVRPSGSDR